MYLDSMTKCVLENGLVVNVRHVPYARTLSLGLFINHGVKDELLSDIGIAHFLEHVVFNPKNMTLQAQMILGRLLDNGALYGAYTGKEMTYCTLTAPKTAQPDLLEVSGHLLRELMITNEQVEHERAILLHEVDTYFSTTRVREE